MKGIIFKIEYENIVYIGFTNNLNEFKKSGIYKFILGYVKERENTVNYEIITILNMYKNINMLDLKNKQLEQLNKIKKDYDTEKTIFFNNYMIY